MPRVIRIEPTVDIRTHTSINSIKKRRVCAYARVSTNSDEQETSYEAQVDYYQKYIQAHNEWEYVGIYADEGVTGTSTKRRNGFKEMMKDALDHKIDLILAKSVSRFARNTVDTLTNIRMLKDNGVEVYFEKENIWTFDSKGEVLLTIMSSLAQEESRSISENVTWGIRKRFSDGKYYMAYKHFLGYEKGRDGSIVINEEQAEIVRFIYRRFLEGATARNICNELEKQLILTPGGKEKWSPSTVLSILSNEKYKGAALLQKTYISDFLSKKVKKNNGELPQYYVENGHAPIIVPADWDVVQEEIARRREAGKAYSSATVLSSKLICEDCGGFFGIKVWHSTDKYRRVIYRCNNKYANKAPCRTNHFTEEEVHKMFLAAYNEYMGNRENIIRGAEKMCRVLSDTTDLTRKLEQKTAQRETKAELYRAWISQGAGARSENFKKHEEKLYADYEAVDKEVNALTKKIADINNRHTKLVNYIKGLQEKPLILEKWDTAMWITTIRHCIVHRDDSVTFVFRDGAEIDIQPAGRTRGII